VTVPFTDEASHAEDLHAWQVLRPLLDAGPYLPWSTWAMRPAALVRVLNEVVLGARTSVVECGSGMSTVVLARLLRERGSGTVVAIEHDGDWAALVRRQLEAEGLGDRAQVLHAPLAGDPPWYDATALAVLPRAVDLLVVDGPPAHRPELGQRRAPALAFFEPRLAPGAVVVLDDARRPGEREVLRMWEAATPWRFAVDEACGIAIGRQGQDPG
jgi:predicted O-methyltransferase YrrM